MKRRADLLVPIVLGSVALGGPAHAARAATPPRVAPPRPVAVYVGSRLVASGQSVSNAVRKVRGQVPFTIRVPRYTPAGYAAAQLAVTPRQRDVSSGFSTLTYALTARGKATTATASGFQIDQSVTAIPFVGGTRVITTTVGSQAALLHELKAAGHDILILTWVDGGGQGYDLVTDAAASHLSISTVRAIAASLH